ncbi:hypothetical protein KLP28_00555 [Nocardioidaceae bacterium]|nr:hypothetical protein KLP28_00555 [Nocardioidaceae bacterium]
MSSGTWASLREAYDEAVLRRATGESDPQLLDHVLRSHDVAPIWTRSGSARDLLQSAFEAEVPQQRLRSHMMQGVPRLMRHRRQLSDLAVLQPEALLDREQRKRAAEAWWAIPDEWIPLSHVTAHQRRSWRPGRSSTALLPLPVMLESGCGASLTHCVEFPRDGEGWHNVLVWLRVEDPEEVVAIADAQDGEHYLLDVMVGDAKVAETLVPIALARVLAGLAAAQVVSDGLLQVNLDPRTGSPYVGRMRCHLPD